MVFLKGGFAYPISKESEFSLRVTIAVVTISCLFGAFAATKQMQFCDDEGNPIKDEEAN